MTLLNPPAGFIGCDVGKTNIVVFDSRNGQTTTIQNRPAELECFAARLDQSCFVVCEATGGYECALLAALVLAGIPAHRADARKVKAFIRSFGTLGKTDAIDAHALARYGQERAPQLVRWQPPDPVRDQLQALVLTRRDLVAERQGCSNRLAAPGTDVVRPYLGKLEACLREQITAIDEAIEALIHNHTALAAAAKTLRGVSGIGPATAAALIALMPELGRLDRRQAAALAGLAPHPNQSGAMNAYRRTKGGRPEVKRTLFMAALSAIKHNKTLKAFYQRLQENGKKPIVALVAVMRKMIVICNALLRPKLLLQTADI